MPGDPVRVGWELTDRLRAAAVVVFILLNVLNAVVIIDGDFDNEGMLWVLLDREGNPATWFSSTILLAGAICAAACALVDVIDSKTFWNVLAIVLVLMSIEEVAQFHELVAGNLSATIEGGLAAVWVIPGSVLAVGILVALATQARRLDPSVRRQLLFGGVLFAVGAMGIELLNETTRPDDASARRYLSIATLEENLELIGAMVIAQCCSVHLRALVGPDHG